MQSYELLFILPGTLAETDVPPVAAKIKETVETSGGTEVAMHDLGKSRLAYPMKHIRYGYFHLVYFTAPAERLPEVQEKLRLMTQPLRIMLGKVDEKRKAMSAKIDVVTDVHEARLAAMAARQARDGELAFHEREAKPVAPLAPAQPTSTKAEDINMKDIDKKLDELLESDIANV